MSNPAHPYEPLTSENAALVLVDHQVGLMSGVRDYSIAELKHNVIGLAKAAKALKLPIVVTTTARDSMWGPTFPELVEALPGAVSHWCCFLVPVAPIDPDVLDKIMEAPRAKQVTGNQPEQPTIEELRRRYGTDDDDELILRALVPEPDLEKMRAAGPVKRDYPLLSSPELDQVHRLMRLAKSPVVQIRSARLSVDLRRRTQ